MFQSNYLLGLLFFICAVHATPVITNSDENLNSQNDDLVYVFNIYAVRNMKTHEVAKIINQKPIEKVSTKFDSIGTFLIADPDGGEPFTLEEFGEFLEDWGATVEKLNDGKEASVIEVKFDQWDDYDEILDIEELMRVLRAEGIVMKITQEKDAIIFEIEFDETIKDPEDQPFTLKELAEFFRDEGLDVEAVGYDGVIKTVRMKFDLPEQATEQDDYGVTEKTDRQLVTPKVVDDNDGVMQRKDHKINVIDNSMDNAIERNFDKKLERKDEHFDDKFNVINFITRARKRRSAGCGTAECRVGNLIKEIVNKYEHVN
ncbi:uncharacterized protein LOC130668475 [Microplitis mediator]|uniref:uncharacterized protein LOC130668475 n=1 Tax=Microplitis mediator TaxID=375433 RepID=UPI0025578171|nr:uncharacterized protein LOC130668475 [Microplitis mediator]